MLHTIRPLSLPDQTAPLVIEVGSREEVGLGCSNVVTYESPESPRGEESVVRLSLRSSPFHLSEAISVD